MSLCGDVLDIQMKKWYVEIGTTGSLTLHFRLILAKRAMQNT